MTFTPHPKSPAKPKKPGAMRSKPKAAKVTTSAQVKIPETTGKSPGRKAKTAQASTGSKTALLMGMLTKPGGASSAEMEAATGWKPHSVRGFLGTLRKKGVNVVAKKFGKGEPTVYSIESAQAAPAEPLIGNPPAEDPGEVV